MRVKICFIAFVMSLLSASPSWADSCGDWNVVAGKAAMKSCTYTGEKGGYTLLKNITNTRAEVCYTIKYARGEDFEGCRTLEPDQEWRTSCFRCAPVNGGTTGWGILKFQPK